MIKLANILREIKARTGKQPKYKIGDTFKSHTDDASNGSIYKIVDIYTNEEAIKNTEFLKNQEPNTMDDWYPERIEDFWYVIKSEDGSYTEFLTHSTLDMPDIFTQLNKDVNEIKARPLKFPKFKVGDEFSDHNHGVFTVEEIFTYEKAKHHPDWVGGTHYETDEDMGPGTFWYYGEVDGYNNQFSMFVSEYVLVDSDLYKHLDEVQARLPKIPKFKAGDKMRYTYKQKGKTGHLFNILEVLTYEEAKQHYRWMNGNSFDNDPQRGPGTFWYYGLVDGSEAAFQFSSEHVLTTLFVKEINEVKARQPFSLDFNNAKIIKATALKSTDFFNAGFIMELIDLGSYYTFVPWPDMTAFYLLPKQNFIIEPDYHETSPTYHNALIETSIEFLKDYKGKKEIIN